MRVRPDHSSRQPSGPQGRDDARSGPGEHQPGRRPGREPEGGADEPREVGQEGDDPATGGDRGQGDGREGRPSEQAEVEHGVVGALLDVEEPGEQDDAGGQQSDHERAPPALASLGQPRQARAHPQHQQEDPRKVEPCPVRAAGLVAAARGDGQPDAGHDQHGVHVTPGAGLGEAGREQRAERDAGAHAGAPHAGRMRPLGRVVEGRRDHPEAGRHHGRATDSLHHASDHEDLDIRRHGRGHGPEGQDESARDEGPPASVVVGDPAGREQERPQPDAHRAEHPGPARRARAEPGHGLVHRGEGRGEGDQGGEGAERGSGEGTTGSGHSGSLLV